MNGPILLDTDIFIDFFRKVEPAKDLFSSLINIDAHVIFSAVTEAELISGEVCNDEVQKLRILNLLSLFTKIPVINRIAITAGDFRRKYKISLQDSFIASTAFHFKAELLTRNIRDFEKIREIKVKKPY